jgi:hypothetical protein
MESIIGAVITGVLALIGVIITNAMSNKSVESNLRTAQAVTDAKLENLTEEVRKHNNFAMKIPVIENRVSQIEKDLRDLRNEK